MSRLLQVSANTPAPTRSSNNKKDFYRIKNITLENEQLFDGIIITINQ